MTGSSLITGGAGFVGANLAHELLSDGESVVIADSFVRDGVRRNAEWLRRTHGGSKLRFEEVDVRDRARIGALVRESHTVYHLAAQVAVTTSLEDPRLDFETNLVGTFNVLEAARLAPAPPAIVFTSTNKVYGALEGIPVERGRGGYRFADRDGIDESAPLDFHSPYGCSKGAAGQYVRDYGRVYGVPTVVFRMSCVYGEHQLGTEDQGWITHFARALLRGSRITIFGDGDQVRDALWVGDLVRALRAAADRARLGELVGEVFNIGGGPENAVSIRTVVDRLAALLGSAAKPHLADWRPGDQRVYVTDIGKITRALGWTPTIRVDEGLERLVGWLRKAELDVAARRRPSWARSGAPHRGLAAESA